MYHDGAFAKRSAPVRSPHEVATRPAAHLHKRPDTLKAAVGRKHPDTTRHSASASHPTIPQTVRRVLGHVYLQTRLAFGRLSHAQTSAVWALVVASALLTLLLALIYPQLASLAGGVWAGSLLMMAGAVVGLEYWHPEWVSRAFATVWPQATFLLLLVLGTAAQSRHLFKLRAAKKNAKADGGKKAKSTGEKK